jgi:hypothetical protein
MEVYDVGCHMALSPGECSGKDPRGPTRSTCPIATVKRITPLVSEKMYNLIGV